jgi:DNA-binding NarL/FixJ family response regulator
MSQKVQILIIDEHPAVSQALVARLSTVPHLEVVAATTSFQCGLQRIRELKPDVVILELKGLSELRLDPIGAISRAISGRSVGVIVLTSYPDDLERAVALQSGAHRYLLKDIDSERLIAEIQQVAEVVHKQMCA